ncbi:MAG: hypothetical protein AABY93_08305 [Bacteroidota bacterium]
MNLDQKTNFQFGILYFAHLLVMVDGKVDSREKAALHEIKLKENIPDWIFDDFEEIISTQTEQQIFKKGIEMLNLCSEEEKLNAFVHLYQLTEADDNIHRKEMRFLLYSLKATKVDFDDVELKAKAVKAFALKHSGKKPKEGKLKFLR